MKTALTSKQQERIDGALRAGIKATGKIKAIEELIQQRVGSKKWANYQMYSLEDGSVAYINLKTLKVKVSEPKSKTGKLAAQRKARAERKAREAQKRAVKEVA